MNREIKFRAWDKACNKMRGVNGVKDCFGLRSDGECYGNFEIMQFTGLKDKNGVDIYEGDVIDLHQTINGVSKFTVEWSNKRMGWTLRYAENMVTPRTYEYSVSEVFSIEEIEVKGNIYENPELLK